MSGIKIPIEGDFSGLNQAMADFASKAKKAIGELNSSPKIDITSAQAGLNELLGSANKIKDALTEASGKNLSNAGLDQLVKGFDQATSNVKTLEQALSSAGVKGGAALAKTAGETRKMLADLQRAQQLQAKLNQQGRNVSLAQVRELPEDYKFFRQNATGAMKRRLQPFDTIESLSSNWRELAGTETSARRHYNEVLRQLGVHAPGGTPKAEGRGLGQFFRQHAARAGSIIGGAITPNLGAAGGLAAGALAEARQGPGGLASLGGLARLGGGLGLAAGAYGAVRAAMAVKGHMDSAEQEGVNYADMLRQLGDTSSTFTQLRESVRDAGKSIDVSFGDASKLAGVYARSAGADGISGKNLGDELRTAGGFSRSLGLQPEAGAGLFAQLRHSKVSAGDADNRRFAMMIGEAVARAGVFTKADEVLSAVANYTDHATRSAMSPANTADYIAAMGNVLNLRQAGMDPQGTAAMLGTVDNAFRAGGGGEAQRNFLLGALQRNMPGMTAVDMGFMQDAGMFATANSVFGKKSAAYGAADAATRARYDKLAAAGGNKTFYDMAMGQLGGLDSDSMRINMKGLFGLSDSQAAVLQKATALHGGSLSDVMESLGSKYNIDPAKLGGTALKNLLDVEFGDEGALRKKAAYFRTQNLSKGELAQLDAAGDDMGKLKSALIEIGKTRNSEQTEGDVSRRTMANTENLATTMATQLVPMTNAIREGITAIASKFGYVDKYGTSSKAQSELDAALIAAGDNPEARRRAIGAMKNKVEFDGGANYTTEFRDSLNKRFIEASEAAGPVSGGNGRVASTYSDRRVRELVDMVNAPHEYDKFFQASGKKHGVDWRDLKQIAAQESGISRTARNGNKDGSIDRGVMQLNSNYDAARGLAPEDLFNPAKNIDAGAATYAQALKMSKGNKESAMRMYNGWTSMSMASRIYGANAMRVQNELAKPALGPVSEMPINGLGDAYKSIKDRFINGAPVPPGAAAKEKAQDMKVSFNGEFHLLNPATGQPVANPIMVAGVGAPRAAGMRGVA